MAKGDIRCGVFEFQGADRQIGLLRYTAATYREGDEFGDAVRQISIEASWPAAVKKATRLNLERAKE